VLTAAETAQPPGTPFTFRVDWNGDGIIDQIIRGSSGLWITHVFPTSQTYRIKVMAVDSANNASPQAAMQSTTIQTVALETDPGDSTRTALVIGGTTGNDMITISPADGTGKTFTVRINGVVQPGGPFAPTGHILVYGQAGADVIREVAATINNKAVKIAVPALLFAGSDGSTLSAAGSSANNILVGGQGNDILTGGSGRDILIGGLGAAVLHAGSGDDILIGGSTLYNANPAALMALMAEWGRTDADYWTRVGHLFGSLGGGANGSFLLNRSSVHGSTASDALFGGPGLDWFFFTAIDRLTNVAAGELATAL
jgi:Ca2+-binding RTX toxin-like protein